ncbi:origin recognition complex subunit 3-like protein [Favolaschia claudopus]|uniref:Origin recognition complex subunit 3-like protein n=1 Tax=Favolaschia claudopus TaxID=2862362 RepID=A0AAW0BCZ7_9AGAR
MSIPLEDIQQTVIYIPYQGDEDSEEETTEPSQTLTLIHPEDDLDNGPLLRFDAYRAAWTQCLDRVKSIIAELYSPVATDIVLHLSTAHTDILPGLPFPELPVITITDVSGSSVFLDHLTTRIDAEAGTMVTHLYPHDCVNLALGMKALISGFVDRIDDAPKRKPATSLAAYDINVLQAWFDTFAGNSDLSDFSFLFEPRPNLVVLLHDFEQFDTSVIQDMLYICSLQVSTLPLTFLLSLAAPSPASYLQASFSRSTLTLIRPYHFAVPSGPEVLNTIIIKTFFDKEYHVHLLPGPTLLEYLEDYYLTRNTSLDSLITILQIAHLKHFTTDVFTVLSITTPQISATPTPTELAFLESLLIRLHAEQSAKDASSQWLARARSPDILLQAVDAEREKFWHSVSMTKLGITIMNVMLTSLRGTSSAAVQKGLDRWRGAAGLRRVLDKEKDGVDGLADVLRKLSPAECDMLSEKIEPYSENLPEEFRPTNPNIHLSDRLEHLLRDLLEPPEKLTSLWTVWYTGFTPFPSEMLNPALRTSIISGLSFPQSFTGQDLPPSADDEDILEDLPDTSILFKGYLKAGKMINVYDWFDHFRTVLESQRARVIRTSSLTKGKGKAKAKGKGKAKKVDDDVDMDGGDSEEKWKLSVQARFIRALHELDYLGFIKHTSRGGGGRKGEFVLKTVLGIVE